MKKLLVLIGIALVLFQSSCATLFGEQGLTSDQRACQHHTPLNGESKRKVRAAAVVCDVVFSLGVFCPVTLGIDFLSGDIYKPCKSSMKYQCTVQEDTLPIQTLPGMVYEDKMVNISFDITSTDIRFTINNKAGRSIKIDWNDVTIIQNGTTSRAVHDGVKLIHKNEVQPPSTIPSNASLDDGVVPSDNIIWNNATEYYSGGWNIRPLLISSTGIKLFLPIQYQGKTIEYNISFTPIYTTSHP